jgi:hypothetical protein
MALLAFGRSGSDLTDGQNLLAEDDMPLFCEKDCSTCKVNQCHSTSIFCTKHVCATCDGKNGTVGTGDNGGGTSPGDNGGGFLGTQMDDCANSLGDNGGNSVGAQMDENGGGSLGTSPQMGDNGGSSVGTQMEDAGGGSLGISPQTEWMPARMEPETVPGVMETLLEEVNKGPKDTNEPKAEQANVLGLVHALSPAEKRAICHFAEEKQIAAASVTLGQVADSEEGLLFWACKGLDLSARGPDGQCFKRALVHDSGSNTVYKDLTDDLKAEFRKWWTIKKDFKFTKDSRTVAASYTKSNSEVGEMKTRAQIAIELGALAFPHDSSDYKSIFAQADQYIGAVRAFGSPNFCVWNSWLQTEQFLFVKKLITSSCEKEWKQVAESSSQIDIWQEKAKESRARRALAVSKGIHVDKVSISDVLGTAEGLDGWADMVVVAAPTCVKAAKCKAKAKAKASALTSGSSGPATLAQAERSVKDLMAKEVGMAQEVAKISAAIQLKPTDWQWALEFMEEISSAEKTLNDGKKERDCFYESFLAASLAPGALRSFKKDQGSNFYPNCLRVLDMMGPCAEKMSLLVSHVRNMSKAKEACDATTPLASASKRRRKL